MNVENTINSLKSKIKVAYNDILFLFRFFLFPFLMVQGSGMRIHGRVSLSAGWPSGWICPDRGLHLPAAGSRLWGRLPGVLLLEGVGF